MLSEMAKCVQHNSSILEVAAVNFQVQGVCKQDLNQIGHGQSQYCMFLSFLFIGGKTTSVSKATDAFYELIRGFTWTYMDIFQLTDSALLETQGDPLVEERYSRNAAALFFLFLQSASVAPSGFHCLCFCWPVVPRKLSKILEPGTIIRLFLHSLKAISAFHQSAEEMKILILLSHLPVKHERFQCFSGGTGSDGLEGFS